MLQEELEGYSSRFHRGILGGLGIVFQEVTELIGREICKEIFRLSDEILGEFAERFFEKCLRNEEVVKIFHEDIPKEGIRKDHERKNEGISAEIIFKIVLGGIHEESPNNFLFDFWRNFSEHQ